MPEGPLGSLITHILMAVDEFHAAATAADVLRSQKELARQGFSAGGRPPVGYRREPVVIGARYDGTPLTRVRWVPDPETAPKVVQAFQMAAEGVTYDEIVAATGICENKSSLATILANPIYRGVRVFNREARVEGEHGRKRRRNPAEDVVTSEVEAVVPEQLWTRVQEMLVRRRKDRLAPQRYAGGYVLTELLRCACGSPMVGTSNRSYRYYRCKVRCGRPSVRANDLDVGVMDLIRRTLVTPKAVRDMVHLLNEDIQMRAERRAPDLDEAKARIRKLQQEDANLRRALRSAGPRASERINVEIEAVAAELEAAQARIAELDQAERPLRITTKLVRQTIDGMNGILDHAPLATRVAWVRDLFERIDVDSRDEKAVAVWRAATDEGVNRSDSVYEWLRRAGAGCVLNRLGSRQWLEVPWLSATDAIRSCSAAHPSNATVPTARRTSGASAPGVPWRGDARANDPLTTPYGLDPVPLAGGAPPRPVGPDWSRGWARRQPASSLGPSAEVGRALSPACRGPSMPIACDRVAHANGR